MAEVLLACATDIAVLAGYVHIWLFFKDALCPQINSSSKRNLVLWEVNSEYFVPHFGDCFLVILCSMLWNCTVYCEVQCPILNLSKYWVRFKNAFLSCTITYFYMCCFFILQISQCQKPRLYPTAELSCSFRTDERILLYPERSLKYWVLWASGT